MLMMGVGSFLGWKMTVASLYFGFISGGIVVIPLLILKKVNRKDSVPLGPFLAFGAAAAMAGGSYALGKFGIAVPWPWFL
ncbi:MAG: prepilin peptidase, partial [Synergistaceae bacterium]